eukprot:c23256_g1_i1 orf=36-1838(+)
MEKMQKQEEEEVQVEVLRTCMVVPESGHVGGGEGEAATRHLFLPGCDSYWRWVPYNGRLLFYANSADGGSGDTTSSNSDNKSSSNKGGGRSGSNDGGSKCSKDDGNYPSLVASLKSSLARTLVDYYPFAGRLSPSACEDDRGRIEILCEGQGVLFVEALAHTSFKKLQGDGFQIKDFFQALAPAPPASADDDVIFSSPLLSIQVTRFLGGEISLGCVHSHVLGDGTSFWNFMVSWAKHARGVNNTHPIVPVHDRTLLDFRGLIEDVEGKEEALHIDVSWKSVLSDGHIEDYVPKEPLVTKVFHFSKEMISRLKELGNDFQENLCCTNITCTNVMMMSSLNVYTHGEIKNSGKDIFGECNLRQRNTHAGDFLSTFEGQLVDANDGKDGHDECKEKGLNVAIARGKSTFKGGCTRFEALCAHLWRRVVASRCLKGNTMVGLVIMIDVRSRVEPIIPKEYVGNAILARTIIATASEILGEPFYETIARIRCTINKITNLAIKREIAWSEGITRHQLAHWGHGFVCLNVVSSPRFPIFDVDFGWHPPSCARPISVGMRGDHVMFAHNRGALVLFPSKDCGIDMCITLQCQSMQNLINDPFLLPR